MAPIDEHSLILWIGIAVLVILASTAGMALNRFFTFRAHRRALDELHRQSVEAQSMPLTMSSERMLRNDT